MPKIDINKEDLNEVAKPTATGTVKFKQVDGLQKAYLTNANGTNFSLSNFNTGAIPIGSYTIKLVCDKEGKEETNIAGTHEVKSMQTKTLKCNCVFNNCQ